MATVKLSEVDDDILVGSTERQHRSLWVWDNNRMVKKTVSYVPALYNIFDQILLDHNPPNLDSLKVNIDQENNCISVVFYNNSNKGDDVGNQYHWWLRLTTRDDADNDDSINKTETSGCGRNGLKVANIFSTHFKIDIADGEKHLRYQQVFTNNMRNRLEPVITKYDDGENWTKVSFKPDLSKFGMGCLEDDVVALMKKRVIDFAVCIGKKVQVELDGKPVSARTFKDYVKLYLPPKAPRIYTKVNERWEICVSVGDGRFEQVSFVNNIATINGGTHVDYIRNQIVDRLLKDNKDAFLKAYNLKRYLWVFVNAHIDNPTFESLNKEALTIEQSSFKSTCELSLDFLEKVVNSKLAKRVMFKAVNKPDLERSIPSMVDGLNSCQRSILFYALKKPIFEEIGVANCWVFFWSCGANDLTLLGICGYPLLLLLLVEYEGHINKDGMMEWLTKLSGHVINI